MQNDFEIIYEDESIVVINKPWGVVVNAAHSVKVPTVQDWMKERYAEIFNKIPAVYEHVDKVSLHTQQAWDQLNRIAFYDRHGVVHRLDKETSGVLLLAKQEESFVNLLKQFKERDTQKVYMALVHGLLKNKEGRIDAPVGRLPWNRERFGVLADGRSAVTDYVVEKEFVGVSLPQVKGKIDFSLVRLFPKTGRTHQLRIHLKHLGHPIVGDHFYAGRKTARQDRSWCGRLMLHAAELTIQHPINQENLTFEASVPDEFSLGD